MLEELAIWYLKRRGIFTLPRTFIGMAVGHCNAWRVEEGMSYDQWRVVVPKGGRLIAVNHSTLQTKIES